RLRRTGRARIRPPSAAARTPAGRGARGHSSGWSPARPPPGSSGAGSWSATSSRTGPRSRPTSSHRRGRAAPTRWCAATGERARRTPRRRRRARPVLAASRSRPERYALEVGELPLGLAVALLEQRVHRLPDGEHAGVLMGPVEAALDPGEDLDEGRRAVQRAEHQRFGISHEAELVQRVPVPAQELDKLVL